ncbi:MAG: OmpA family protein, partial [Hyphomicrobium sp.]
DLQRSLPGVALNERLSVVAGSGITIPDVTPELTRVRQELAGAVGEVTRAAVMRSAMRAETRLTQASADLARAISVATDASQADVLKGNRAEVNAILSEMKRIGGSAEQSANGENAGAYQALALRVDALGNKLLRSSSGEPGDAPAEQAAAKPADAALPLDAAVELFAAGTERIAALASTVAVAKALRPTTIVTAAPPPPAPEPTPPPQPSPRERLDAFTRSHAIFFGSNLEYRNAETSARTLAELAQLITASTALVRVVGYTDEAGAQNRNDQLAQERAAKVRTDLIGLGVPATQIVTVGRANAIDLSDTRGAESPNRRVEFEIGFEGEAQP